MVNERKQYTRQKRTSKGRNKNRSKSRKINASTHFETCTEQLSPFGGLLALIKFLDLIDFKQIFNSGHIAPTRMPKLGHYRMIVGLLMLLFIGFNRIWHFTYIRLDAMLCGFFRLQKLPVASTFWRYVDSMGINQGQSLIKITSILRERVWKQLGLNYYRIRIDIDTTVETLLRADSINICPKLGLWGRSLWQRLCLRSFCNGGYEEKTRRTTDGGTKPTTPMILIAKDVQTKVAGSGWGEGVR